MDILKRPLAPLTDAAWEEIESNAKRALVARLAGRKVVDVSGPHGWDHAAVGLGRLEIADKQPEDAVRYGIHRVQPLVEVRIRFSLDIWEIDNISRGAKDANTDAVIEAAQKISDFEDNAIFNGFEKGGIEGILGACERDPIPLELHPDGYLDAVSRAVLRLQDEGIEGPYTLVVGPEAFQALSSYTPGYPLLRQVERLIEGKVVYSKVVSGGLLLSTRGGDLELTLGQDLSIGYHEHDTTTVWLYITESFTFRVLDPDVIVPLQAKRR